MSFSHDSGVTPDRAGKQLLLYFSAKTPAESCVSLPVRSLGLKLKNRLQKAGGFVALGNCFEKNSSNMMPISPASGDPQ
jgi:hypothetical protein